MNKIQRLLGKTISDNQLLGDTFNMEIAVNGTWIPSDDTPKVIKDYLKTVQKPSLRNKFTYMEALKTPKFAKYLCANAGDIALKMGIAIEME